MTIIKAIRPILIGTLLMLHPQQTSAENLITDARWAYLADTVMGGISVGKAEVTSLEVRRAYAYQDAFQQRTTAALYKSEPPSIHLCSKRKRALSCASKAMEKYITFTCETARAACPGIIIKRLSKPKRHGTQFACPFVILNGPPASCPGR